MRRVLQTLCLYHYVFPLWLPAADKMALAESSLRETPKGVSSVMADPQRRVGLCNILTRRKVKFH